MGWIVTTRISQSEARRSQERSSHLLRERNDLAAQAQALFHHLLVGVGNRTEHEFRDAQVAKRGDASKDGVRVPNRQVSAWVSRSHASLVGLDDAFDHRLVQCPETEVEPRAVVVFLDGPCQL